MPVIKRVHKEPNEVVQILGDIYCDFDKKLFKKVPSTCSGNFLFEEIDFDKLINHNKLISHRTCIPYENSFIYFGLDNKLIYDCNNKTFFTLCGNFAQIIDLDDLINKAKEKEKDMLEYSIMNCTHVSINDMLKVDSKTYMTKDGEVFHLNDGRFDKINYELHFERIEKQTLEKLKEEYKDILKNVSTSQKYKSIKYMTTDIFGDGTFNGGNFDYIDDGFTKLISIIKEKSFNQVFEDLCKVLKHDQLKYIKV